MRPETAFAVLLLALVPPAASAWDNVETHRRLTDAALARANSDGKIDEYLRQSLGVDSIEEPRLPLVIGYDGDIDKDIGPKRSADDGSDVSRLNCSLNQRDDICVENAIPDKDRTRMSEIGCEGEPGGEADSCDRYSVAKLLRVGSYAEDSPTPRASSHFFEPIGQTGLDNSTLFLAGLDVLAADSVTTARYGGEWLRLLAAVLTTPFVFFDVNVGNFDLDGDPAPDWALGTSGPPDNFISNRFSSVDAERYLFRALTAPTPLERDHYLGLHVLAVGHVAHVLEDMGNPAHTRNDFVVDHVWHQSENLEIEGRQPYALGLVEAAGTSDDATPRTSLPGVFITSSTIQPLLAAKNPAGLPAYTTTLPTQPTAAFDLRDFWESGSGLARLSHDRFFSGGSSSGQFDSPGRPGCSRNPNLPLGQPVPPPDDGVYLARLPGRDPVSRFDLQEEPGTGEKTQFFYSSALVPHLANCRYHALPQRQAQITGSDFHWAATTIDESVKRDYVEILLPLTVDYTAKFLKSYFQSRIELVPLGNGRFKLRNLTNQPFAATAADLQVVFDDANGIRQRMPTVVDSSSSEPPAGNVKCDGNIIELEAKTGDVDAAASEVSCRFPTALGGELHPPKNSSEFWVVLRGALGRIGEVTDPDAEEDDWKDKNFVTVFARGENAALYNGAGPELGYGMSASDWDATEQEDIYWSPLDLEGASSDESAPTKSVNLTGRLRVDPRDDFVRAKVSEQSGQIALVSDVGIDLQDYVTTSNADYPTGGLPTIPTGLRTFISLLNPGAEPAASRFRQLGHVEDDNGFSPIWIRGRTPAAFFARRTTVPAVPGDTLTIYDAATEMELSHPAFNPFPVVGAAADLMTSSGESPQFGCILGGQFVMGAKEDQALGLRIAALLKCAVVAEDSNGQAHATIPFGGQLVILDGQGQPLQTVLVDADDARAPEVRPCVGACSFDGFATPDIKGAEFSPVEPKIAFLVSRPGDLEPRNHRIYVYNYLSGEITQVPESRECMKPFVSWSADGKLLGYLAKDEAGACSREAGMQVYVTKADGSQPTPTRATNFTDDRFRGLMTWYSPLQLPTN